MKDSRGTARIAPTIHVDVENREFGMVGATLAVPPLSLTHFRSGERSASPQLFYGRASSR